MAEFMTEIIQRGLYVVRHDPGSKEAAIIDDIKGYVSVLPPGEWKQLYRKPDNQALELSSISGRCRYSINAQRAAQISSLLSRDWRGVYPMSVSHTWTVESGADLFPHRDFPIGDGAIFCNHVNVPAGMIVAMRTMAVHLYGWNCLVAEDHRHEKFTLKAGDVFIYRGSMIYKVDEPASLYMHAYLEPESAAQFITREMPNALTEVRMLQKATLPAGTFCPMAGCTYNPWGSLTRGNIIKHFMRKHGLRRVTWQEEAKGGVSISELVSANGDGPADDDE